MLDPTTLPSATSAWRLMAAATEVASSGRLVPTATIERPIVASDRPAARAILEAELTSRSAPKKSAANPPASITVSIHPESRNCVSGSLGWWFLRSMTVTAVR